MNSVTIEVFDGGTPAAAWLRAWHDHLVETAVTSGARFWDEREHRWGVVLVYTHRGGGRGCRQPSRPHPRADGGTASLPEPDRDAGRVLPCTPCAEPAARGPLSW